MDYIYLPDSRGEFLVPIWSLNAGTTFCSFLAPPSSVSPQLLKYANEVPMLLEEATPTDTLIEVNIAKYAFWYNPREHWLGFIPNQPPPEGPFYEDWVDPIKLVFSEAHVSLVDQSNDGYDSDGRSTGSQWYGVCVNYDWANRMCELGDALESVWRNTLANTDFYRKGRSLGVYGETPRVIDKSNLKDTFRHEDYAKEAILRARLALKSQVGFIAWLFTVVTVKDAKLSEEDENFLAAMRLPERPKTGYVYNLSRDRYEVNFQHLANHKVPFHYAWTQKEENDSIYLRYSPEYHREVSEALRDRGNPRVQDVPIQSLHSYPEWQRKLNITDWELRNISRGKRGGIVTDFKPDWSYEVVYEFGYGAKPLFHWNVIRAYAERFKAAVHEGEWGTLCTFFRYNPLGIDEPPFDRPTPVHQFSLTDFATNCPDDYPPEKDFYYESTTRARERSKTLYAPRPNRMFNSFNGHLVDEINLPQGPRVKGRPRPLIQRISRVAQDSSSGSYGEVLEPSPLKARLGPFAPPGFSPPPSPAGSRSRSPVLSSDWAKKMARGRTRSSRSLSPNNKGKGKQRRRSLSAESSRTLDSARNTGPPSVSGEFYSVESRAVSPSRMDLDEPSAADDAVVTAGSSGIPVAPTVLELSTQYRYETRRDAEDAFTRWIRVIVELEPRLRAYSGAAWNLPWLASGVLVFDDSRTLIRLKGLAAVYPLSITNIREALDMALRYGMPFEIYIPLAMADDFRDPSLSTLSKNSLASIYGAGYNDQLMTWTGLGEEHQYGVYQGTLLPLLQRPNAVAFIAKGGICKYVAELYAPDLVYRYVRGPSAQVSEFARGKTRRITKGSNPGLYTADQVSDTEVSMLLGHVKGAHAGADKTLWPPQALFEKYSPHMRGYLSAGAYNMLDNIRRRIVEEQCYEWRTRSEWVSYLRGGGRGKFTPAHVPDSSDFEHGSRMLAFSFPRDWECEKAAHVVLPEVFEPNLIMA
ncbi:hypothetical protein R3P38DRAFT_3181919 [Favolaschia claudopus]|uniref:Uncharacterized protein n=1 Tax=Favolaschia claudopus TaxID=2862362 RepID=A0AAW0CFK0_9AGAR